MTDTKGGRESYKILIFLGFMVSIVRRDREVGRERGREEEGEESLPIQREVREGGRLRRGGYSSPKQREVSEEGRRSTGLLKYPLVIVRWRREDGRRLIGLLN